jgi:DNA processing protein
MTEGKFYNALNIATDSGYKKLFELFGASGAWEKAWRNFSAREKSLVDPEKEWEKLQKLGVRLILRNDPDYPPQLGEIPFPPFGIYALGALPRDFSAIAIVGTRKATSDGKELACKLAGELSDAGLFIASGLAFGIDAAAHEGCLRRNGKTIAVLACGLDFFYPRSNEKLAQKILAGGGAIVSEYPLGAEPLPYRFLERNRIVSGLSRGVLIIEAPKESGALATARFATDQNRELFVVPGAAMNPNFYGSHRLIRSGALLVTSAEEILSELGLTAETNNQLANASLAPEEKVIYETIKIAGQPLDIDKIIELSNLEASAVNEKISRLVIKNLLKETPDGYTIS